MPGMRRHKAFLAIVATAVIAHSLVYACLGTPSGEIARPAVDSPDKRNADAGAATSGKLQGHAPSVSVLPEGKNPAYQVAALLHDSESEASAGFEAVSSKTQPQTSLNDYTPSPPTVRLGAAKEAHKEVDFPQISLQYGVRRRLEGRLPNGKDIQELLSEHTFPHSGVSSRRLQLLSGLSQLTAPLSTVTNLFSSGMSAREKDQLDSFTTWVSTSKERLYKDMVFITGAKKHGMDEFAMKQLIKKVGLESFSTGEIPSNVSLTHQESLVLDAARRSRFQVDMIITTYEREVAQHVKKFRQGLQGGMTQTLRSAVTSVASNGLFKHQREIPTVRRLEKTPRLRRLAPLVGSSGLLGAAGSLFRSLDPSNLSHSLSAGLGGLGLHHLHLPNIGGLNVRDDGAMPTLPPLADIGALQEALQNIFPGPQQANALSGPLRSFQQGVSIATDGAVGAFLSREGLLPFLSVDTAKHLLGGFIGGEAIAPHGVSGWGDLGLSPAAASGLAAAMPFETFLTKLGELAQEVDSEVGAMKRETKRRINAEGLHILPEQLGQVDNILNTIVWGALRPPVRRLQQNESAESESLSQDAEGPKQSVDLQQEATIGAQQQIGHTQQEDEKGQPPTTESPQPSEISPTPQREKEKQGDDEAFSSMMDALLQDVHLENTQDDAEEEIQAGLQRIELLADAVTVLLKEYEKAVEHLQELLEDQIDTAEEIREELHDEVKDLREKVHEKKATHPRAATAAAEVAKAYDEAVEGLKETLEGLLQQQPTTELPAVLQQPIAALAAKIEAAVDEKKPSPLAAH
ncbi:uncharacterized protein LOC34624596 [Cyclospora cayetanensis]|uniref:Uncharacterized protein LOC34624596 n=1 Tax=Cyclospora cayetanensis TaxID=88456 RepID=A0A6P5WDY2_9EIME|nr:uncharacterized protein LOC34624596 [Cyclospora cayetanensis]